MSKEALEHNINGCIENRRECQKEIYSAFYGYALSICLRYVSNQEEAVEVINDGFVKIFKEIYHYKPSYTNSVSSFSGWLRTIMVHTSIDHYRKNHKIPLTYELSEAHNQIGVKQQTAIDKISYAEVLEAMRKLSPGYKTVLNLFVVEELSHQEIAERLEITVGTSKSNLYKARKQLQSILLQQNNMNNATGR